MGLPLIPPLADAPAYPYPEDVTPAIEAAFVIDPLDSLRTALQERYAVERLIGQGGMATVYLAMDTRHDRRVAIKVLRPELAA